MRWVQRAAETRLLRLLRSFPAVIVQGPRQAGKSSLVRRLLPEWTQLDLERPADREALAADVEGFFDTHPRRVVLDEAQRMPEVFDVLRHVIDRGRSRGRFVLTGSASPSLVRAVSETLAGRAAYLDLTPFLCSELASTRHAPDRWFWGGLPPVHDRRGVRERGEWLDAYVTAFLERDVPALGLRLSAERLRVLWTMLTQVHGNLLNVSDLARSLGVSSHTVQHNMDVLASAFMIRRLPPFYANVQKRLTKSPKIYVRDTGLLHFLAGLRRPSELRTWARVGASFEGLVIEELASQAAERLVRPEVFFWRTQAGAEVDLLVVSGRRILPIEIKMATAVGRHDVAGLRQCMKDLGIRRGLVVCTAKQRREIGGGIELVPWSVIERGAYEWWRLLR